LIKTTVKVQYKYYDSGEGKAFQVQLKGDILVGKRGKLSERAFSCPNWPRNDLTFDK